MVGEHNYCTVRQQTGWQKFRGRQAAVPARSWPRLMEPLKTIMRHDLADMGVPAALSTSNTVNNGYGEGQGVGDGQNLIQKATEQVAPYPDASALI